MENPCLVCARARLEARLFEEVTCYLNCDKLRQWILWHARESEVNATQPNTLSKEENLHHQPNT